MLAAMDPARDPGAGRGPDPGRPAEVADVHALATAMPHVTCVQGPSGNPVYQVGGKSFVFFRTPRPDATDPRTGERYADVIMFWVASETEKLALVDDPGTPVLHDSALRRPPVGARQGGAAR